MHMDIQSFISCKRSGTDLSDEPDICSGKEVSGGTDSATSYAATNEAEVYKSKLSYKKEWESMYPWVTCELPSDGMFCSTCQKWGSPPAGSRGAWTIRGVTDWNHATELLKQHAGSQWHRKAAATAAMAHQAESGLSVLELQCSSAAHEATELRQRNREVLLKLLRSTYFLVKNRIPHTTIYPHMIELQVTNGDKVLQKHINQGPSNAQYTSSFSLRMFVQAIDTWVERKLQSLKSSLFFSVLAVECQDISTQEELSICCRWLVNGCIEEHFLTILHVTSTDAATITDALTSFIRGRISITYDWLDKGTMVRQHFLVAKLSPEKDPSTCSTCSLYPLLLSSSATCLYTSSRVSWNNQEDVRHNDNTL